MGERAMAYLAAHFSKDLVIQEYEETLRRVARARGRQV